MSIVLNQEDIRNIDSEQTQQRIINAISRYVKEIAATTYAKNIEIDVFSRQEQSYKGVPGAQLLHFAGTIDQDSIKEISDAIESSCEKVNPDEW